MKSLHAIDSFHRHLDECPQCDNNPFNLCPVGVVLIKKAGVAAGVLRDDVTDDALQTALGHLSHVDTE